MDPERPTRSRQELAYQYLKDLISRVPATASRFITEAEVANALGISRTPVREAFRNLEVEQLLQLVMNKGAFIPPMTDETMSAVMEARGVVETFCAQRAASRDPGLAVQLEELLANQRSAIGEMDQFIARDRTFHMAIVKASGQEIFTQFYASLRDRQLRMGVGALGSSAQRTQEVLIEHQRIVDAVKLGDPGAIRVAIEEHINSTLRVLRPNIARPRYD